MLIHACTQSHTRAQTLPSTSPHHSLLSQLTQVVPSVRSRSRPALSLSLSPPPSLLDSTSLACVACVDSLFRCSSIAGVLVCVVTRLTQIFSNRTESERRKRVLVVVVVVAPVALCYSFFFSVLL